MNRVDYWIPAYEAVLRHPMLTALDAHVHGYLARCRMQDKPAFPSQKKIATTVGSSSESIRKSLRRLRDAGIIESEGRARDDGSRASNSYRVLLPSEWNPTFLGASGLYAPGPPGPGVPGPHLRETEEEKKPSAKASGRPGLPEDLDACKPPYGSVATEIRKLFENASPGGAYRFSKSDGGVLKKVWDEVDDMPSMRRVLASGGILVRQDEFWRKNWSPRFLLTQVSKLMNATTAAAATGGIDESERVAEAARAGAIRACADYGIREPLARGVLEKHGITEDQQLRDFAAILSTPAWRDRFLDGKRTALEVLIEACTQYGTTPTPGGKPATSWF